MPTVQGTDNFNHGNFAVPGGGPYRGVEGAPVKDTGVVHSPEVASLLIEATTTFENVQYQITGLPTLGWLGFWFRQNTADEIGNFILGKFFPTAGGAGEIAYLASSNQIYQHIAGSSTFPGLTISLDTWVWIESIFDVSGATRRMRTRVGGVDLTAEDFAIAASTVSHLGIGNMSADSAKCRFSNAKWGTAASLTDWLGEPSGLTLDSCLPDADVVTTGWSTAPLFSKVNDASDATVIQATAS